MADPILKTFRDKFKKLLEYEAKSLRDTEKQRPFFDPEQFADFDAIYKLFERKDQVQELRGLLDAPHSAAKWARLKSQAEYLSGLERDVRARFRNRLDRYRAASLQKELLLKKAVEEPALFIEAMQADDV